MISIIILIYYLEYIFCERDKPADKHSHIQKNKKLSKNQINWNLNSFDVNQLTFFNRAPHIMNIFENFTQFLVPLILVFSNNFYALPALLLFMLFGANVFYFAIISYRLRRKFYLERKKVYEAVQHKMSLEAQARENPMFTLKQGNVPEHLQMSEPHVGRNAPNFGQMRAKFTPQEFGHRLKTIVSLKKFENWIKLMLLMFHLIFWLTQKSRNLTFTIVISVINSSETENRSQQQSQNT